MKLTSLPMRSLEDCYLSLSMLTESFYSDEDWAEMEENGLTAEEVAELKSAIELVEVAEKAISKILLKAERVVENDDDFSLKDMLE